MAVIAGGARQLTECRDIAVFPSLWTTCPRRGVWEGDGEKTGVKKGAEFSLPPRSKLLSKPTWIGRGPQGPFGKLIRKVVTDALAIKKKGGEKLS